MESSQQVAARPLISRVWPWMFAAIGLFDLADWIYGGRQNLLMLLAGIGFILMVPGASRIAMPKYSHYRLFLALSWLGLGLVLASIALRWL